MHEHALWSPVRGCRRHRPALEFHRAVSTGLSGGSDDPRLRLL